MRVCNQFCHPLTCGKIPVWCPALGGWERPILLRGARPHPSTNGIYLASTWTPVQRWTPNGRQNGIFRYKKRPPLENKKNRKPL